MRPPSQFRRRNLGLQMTSLIDVVFLLLIFFLWTTSMDPPESHVAANVALAAQEPAPQSGASGDAAPGAQIEPIFDDLVVRLQAVPRGATEILLNDQPVADRPALAERLGQIAALGVQPVVIIDPHDDVPLGQVMAVYETILQAEVAEVYFAAQP